MKNILFAAGCAVLLCACSTPQTPAHAWTVDFRTGTTRETVEQQLKDMQATILEDKPDFVRATVVKPDVTHPVPIELRFADGKLTNVTYGPEVGGSFAP